MSADFILQYMKTEIQLLSQKIERMVMKKIDDMDAKMSNMIETKNKESQSIVQRERAPNFTTRNGFSYDQYVW